MADQPNKRMDETLKAYAEKRRQEAGAPLELHPATRQMLQAEVARTYKHAARASWLQRAIIFWPRIAFAAACLAITLTLVLLIRPPGNVTEMAQTTTLGSEALSRDARVADKEKTDSYGFLDAPAPPASTVPVTPSRSLERLEKRNEVDELKATSEVLAEVRKDTANVRLMREDPASKPGRQPFDNLAGGADKSVRARYKQETRDIRLGARLQEPAQPILNNFELEQVGNVVRLYDEDGSVYSGNFVVEEQVKKQLDGKLPQNTPAARSAAGPAPVEQQLFFRAAGTNLRLNQQVSIEANILQLSTNLPALAPSKVPIQNQQRGVTQQTIQGRARVGTNQEVLINAVPAQP